MKTSTGSIHEQAAEFVFELAAPGPLSAAVEQQLAEWLSLSPAHEAAFLEATEAFDRLCLVDPGHRIDVQTLLARNPAAAAQLQPPDAQTAEDPTPSAPKTDSTGRIGRIVAALAGYDLDLVQRYAGVDAEHERKRLVRMGLAVIIPAFLGLFTAFFLLEPFVEVLPTRIVMAAMASLFILVVDSIIVATLSKHGGAGTIIRILISVCMGVVISEPLLISLYKKTIDAQIAMTSSRESDERQRVYESQLSQDEEDAGRYRKLLANDLQELAGFQPMALAARHARQQQKQRNELLSDLRAQRDAEIARLYQQRSDLGGSSMTIQEAIEGKTLDLEKEVHGKRASGKAGRGPVFATLQKNIESLRVDLDRVNELIAAIDGKIQAMRHDTAGEDRLNASYDAINIDAELSPADKLMQSQLKADAAAHEASLAAIRRHQDEVRTAIARLPEEFALSTRVDSLSQTQALYEILRANGYLQIKVVALFLLLFLIDIAPVVVKLTVVTEYDQYVRKLQVDRYARETVTVESDQVNTRLLASHARRIESLNAFATKIAQGMTAADTWNINEKRIKSVTAKLARAVEQQVDETLTEAAYLQGSYSRPGMFVFLKSALKIGWYLLKTKGRT